MNDRDSPLPIDDAPYRIRRAYHRSQRRNTIIAVCVLISAAIAVVLLVWLLRR